MNQPSFIDFSVIVPTFNRPQGLARTLASLCAQTHRPFEVVVINDGDTDPTPVIDAAGLEAAGIGLKLVNGGCRTGPAAARNRGLAAATGTVIAYLDDDDEFTPDHLALHAEHYADPAAQVVYSDAERAMANGSDRKVIHSMDHDRDALLVANYIPILCLTHRRACLEASGLFEESLTSLVDWDLFIRLSEHYDFVHLAQPTGVYYEEGLGVSVQEQNRSRFVENMQTVYERTAPFLERDEERHDRVWKLRMANFGRMMADTAAIFEQQGDVGQALLFYERAAKADPTPERYMTLARLQKSQGLKREALISMHLAHHCLNPEDGE